MSMKITFDLETNEIVAPKNFFEYFAKQNEMLKRMSPDAKEIKPIEFVKTAFVAAIENSDKNFKTRK